MIISNRETSTLNYLPDGKVKINKKKKENNVNNLVITNDYLKKVLD